MERALIEHVERGEILDLARDQPVDETTMRAWGESRTIRSWVVRDIVRGRLAADPDPHGLRLRGVRIAGRVDLENITSTVAIELDNCLLEEGLNARDARIPVLVLSACRLEHPSEPPLDAHRLIATVLFTNTSTITGHSNQGAITLVGARIGQLACDGATLRNDSGPALHADGLQVDQSMFLCGGFTAIGTGDIGAVRLLGAHIGELDCDGATLRNDSGPALHAYGLQVDRGMFLRGGFTATGTGDIGAVRLLGARIGQLECDGATLRNDSGPALIADGLQVDRGMFLRGGFTATGTGDTGAVRLLGARIGQLECDGATLRNDSGPALTADRLQVDQSMFLRGGFNATGAGEAGAIQLLGAHIGELDCIGATLRNDSGPALHADGLLVDQSMFLCGGFTATGTGDIGAVRLIGAHIGSVLDCDGATLCNDSGPALDADRLQVDQSMFLRGGFTATGTGDIGAVRLIGAHIGQLNCVGATLRNDSGPALHADGLQVDQRMFLRGGFTATGTGDIGAVCLLGAHIGELDCTGATLCNDSGPALHADGLQIDRGMFLRGGFTATGTGSFGAVCLLGAHIGSVLDCDGATLRNDSGPALHAYGLQVDQSVYLSDGFAAIGGGDSVAVNLTGLRVGSTLVFDPERLEHTTDSRARLAVDGLVYSGLPEGISADSWLELLREGTPSYAAQPYQQLAAAHRAAGHDSHARRVLMAQRQDQIGRRALTGRAERTWVRFTGLTLGYGYQPWRALIGLLVVVVAAVVLAVVLGGHGGLTQLRTPPPSTALECTVVERIGVGLDLGIPLITTGARARCEATNTTTGQILTSTSWALRLLAWAFATLFIAGFTSAVRKT
ncbi:hypothetical protein OG205_13885 [Lentzea sp. NBC_00516]|uniref:hypothetical protein n=1 Tax=Lentzea sp. NBC_00516 TaxID=2903582 RepID=UPI002E820F64|nr:hypothetical protein [Lentzea sp. NBC_00516]WUD28039.1 hypothetical protein OG205_13885 [Lentzea sp. NBC_00516]